RHARARAARHRDRARLERLKDHSAVEACRRHGGGCQPEQFRAADHWHDPAMRRRLLTGTGAAAAWWALPALAPIAPLVANMIGAPRRFDSPGDVALTFDDGPHPEGTPA